MRLWLGYLDLVGFVHVLYSCDTLNIWGTIDLDLIVNVILIH